MKKVLLKNTRSESSRPVIIKIFQFQTAIFVYYTEFCRSIKPDEAKSIMKYPKIILEGLALWPGKESLGRKILNTAVFISLCFMEWGHVSYVAANITNVVTVASACTTVFSTFQVNN